MYHFPVGGGESIDTNPSMTLLYLYIYKCNKLRITQGSLFFKGSAITVFSDWMEMYIVTVILFTVVSNSHCPLPLVTCITCTTEDYLLILTIISIFPLCKPVSVYHKCCNLGVLLSISSRS